MINKISKRLLWAVAITSAIFVWWYAATVDSKLARSFLVVAGFFGPFFAYQLYLMWERRESLKMHYDLAKAQFAVIKARKNIDKSTRKRGGNK